MAKPKTPTYVKRAYDNYRAKKDTIQLYADLGERDKFRSVGLDNATILEIIREEYRKRVEG